MMCPSLCDNGRLGKVVNASVSYSGSPEIESSLNKQAILTEVFAVILSHSIQIPRDDRFL
jgi:hypothetical protein